jgi:hypothetical protein
MVVADQPLVPVGEGGVVAAEPIGAVGGERRVTLFQRMSMSGWWLAASAASAARLTNRVAVRKWS